MKVDSRRIEKLNTVPFSAGPVIYWVSRDQRVGDNWALLYAQELALASKQPLMAVFCLVPEFLGATLRQYRFMLKGLVEMAKGLQELNIGFVSLTGQPEQEVARFCLEQKAGALVSDFSPLRLNRAWKSDLAARLNNAFYEVDAHNIVPCRFASAKQEYAAYTFRPKVKKLLPDFLTDFPSLIKHPYPATVSGHESGTGQGFALRLDSMLGPGSRPQPGGPGSARVKGGEPFDRLALENSLSVDRTIEEVTAFIPGEKAGKEAMQGFILNRLSAYPDDRNDPTRDGQSNLSPYLHFGQLSAQRLALAVSKSGGPQPAVDAFLEELIVRKELSDNFCFYNDKYDQVEGFPRWARESLDAHRDDKREFLYPLEIFDGAATHDELWNAAQNEMKQNGKMHGYMRMYWAKKILEWTESPEQAMQIAVYLNDRYSLDGRDPNGYSGIAWSIGGVHDRAWFDRPIFGKVRYMSYKGSKAKFNIEKYIEKCCR